MNNYAFIDGQNLHLGTKEENWSVDFQKFRIYLNRKYKVTEIYYFIGYFIPEYQKLYDKITEAGYILIFKPHSENLSSRKKGNVDIDIVTEVFKNLIENRDLNKIVIVSGDGDYLNMIKYLIEKNKFLKILFPNDKPSSLYKELRARRYDYLSIHQDKMKRGP